jgi:hypothetical protein
MPSNVQAFEPLSLLTAVIGPVVCKIIGCKNNTRRYIFIEHPAQNRKRLLEMQKNFEWGGYYTEGDCRDARKGLDKKLTVCYHDKQWRIVK